MVHACAIRNITVINLIRLCEHLAIRMKQIIENFGLGNRTKHLLFSGAFCFVANPLDYVFYEVPLILNCLRDQLYLCVSPTITLNNREFCLHIVIMCLR